VYGRGNSGISGERECKREKNDGKIQIWMEEEERRWRMCYEERNKAFVVVFTIEHFAVLFLVKRNQKRFLVQLD
jgi:hypothetical protein